MSVAGGFINMASQMAAIVAPLVIGYLVDASGGGFATAFAGLIVSTAGVECHRAVDPPAAAILSCSGCAVASNAEGRQIK